MIGLLAIFKRGKRAELTAQNAPPPEEKQRQPEPRIPARFMGGACEKTHDLLVGHDGERVGFRKPVQG
jgi:hypothetical protein